MKKYVVTGAAGFIGSALVRGLLARNDGEVEAIDNFSTGHRANLSDIASEIRLHVLDVCDFDAIAPVIAGADTVFHIAAIPSVPRSIADPVPSHESNIDGTFNVLRASVEGKARKVIYAASSTRKYCRKSKRCGRTPSLLTLPRSFLANTIAAAFLTAMASTLRRCASSMFTDHGRTHLVPTRVCYPYLFVACLSKRRPLSTAMASRRGILLTLTTSWI